MFQTFENTASPQQGPPRLAQLRQKIASHHLDGFLVPHADRFQGEYVAPCDDRLAWLTGFTGSAGFACVLPDLAGVFVDGRYRLQIQTQVADVFTPVHWPEIQLADWLTIHLPHGGVVGFDPWLHTVAQLRDLTQQLAPAGITLRAVDNLIDAIWTDRQASPRNPICAHPDHLTGEAHHLKRARLADALPPDRRCAAFIALPDSLCWLLNIRGTDIPRNPVVQAYGVLHDTGRVDVFTDADTNTDITLHLGADVQIRPFTDLAGFFSSATQVTFQIDPASAPHAVLTHIRTRMTQDATVMMTEAQDPCILPKAIKNPVEIAGARAAALRDGAAMVRFLAWLDRTAPDGKLTEIDVVQQLEGYRRATNALCDISFETICGAGPHGAIVHYRVTDDTNRAVKPGELLLIDSGGQYVDGTTDITRTVIIGTPTDEHRTCYTLVLQGMIALSRAQFPKGVAGQHLDALARFPLWTAGMDYDHGTGHGVGSYLSVHEGPQGISRKSTVPLEIGMILSNEPGYYRAGAFGIRIENLITVVQAQQGVDGRDMRAFETLTHVPLDRRLIDLAMVSDAERDWIDAYHCATFTILGGMVDDDTAAWLKTACAPLCVQKEYCHD